MPAKRGNDGVLKTRVAAVDPLRTCRELYPVAPNEYTAVSGFSTAPGRGGVGELVHDARSYDDYETLQPRRGGVVPAWGDADRG